MRSIRLVLLLLVWCVGLSSIAQEYTVREVPNTRYYSDTIHTSDPDDWILPEYEAKIDHVLSAVRDEADVFVVVLSSIGDDNIEEFGTDLFNFWGIGERDRNNGVLILMVEDQHKIRFEVGYGMESTLTDALCSKIIYDVIIPYFKEDDYNEGLYAGVCAVAGVLGYLPEDSAVDPETIELIKKPEEKEPWGFLEWAVLIAYLIFAVVFFFIFVRSLRKNVQRLKNDNEEEVNKAYKSILSDEQALLMFLIVCTPVSTLLPIYFAVANSAKKKYRNKPRVCSCGHEMRRLSEAEEDPYLNENQLFEENNLKVKDYDVWYCDACHATKILGYSTKKAERYYICPSCQCLAGKKKYDSTVISPTTSSKGEGLHHIVCQKCGHEFTISYVIPKLSKSSGGSGGSGSGGGGSFGGGSSGGGGATGSW